MRKLLALLFSLGLLASTVACESERRSQSGGSAPPAQEAVAAAAGNEGEGAGAEEGVPAAGETRVEVRGDLPRLAMPSELEQREGKAVESEALATLGSSGAGPGNNWAFDSSSSGGFFLVAASSRVNTAGGDVLRRVDLRGAPQEYDFNPHVEGAQGMHVLVPSAMRGQWHDADFSGDGLFVGRICGLVPGPAKRVFALAGRGAFLLDPYTREEAVTPEAVIVFPFGTNICRGVYSESWQKLFAIDVGRTGASGGQRGVYVADLPAERGKNVLSSLYLVAKDYGFNSHSKNTFQSVNLFGDALYLIEGNARFNANWDTGVHKVPLNVLGEPLFSQAVLVRAENPIDRAQGCPLSADNLAGSLVVPGTPPTLLTGGTRAVVAWDLSQTVPVRVDMDPRRPGVQGVDMDPFGQGAARIMYAPSGEAVYVMPHCRSGGVKVDLGGGYGPQHALRLAELTLAGGTPALAGDGLDAGFVTFLQELIANVKPSYLPTFRMTYRDMAVGVRHVGLIGSGVSGASGLGPGSDMVIIDFARRSPLAFAEPSDPRRAHELTYGFRFAAGDSDFGGKEQSSHAIMWIP